MALFMAIWINSAPGLFAQETQSNPGSKVPRWISDKGYWQIESNIYKPDKNIVYFYNNENELVYKEHLEGIVLNLKKKYVKMRLKKALEIALQMWNRDRAMYSDRQLITRLFK